MFLVVNQMMLFLLIDPLYVSVFTSIIIISYPSFPNLLLLYYELVFRSMPIDLYQKVNTPLQNSFSHWPINDDGHTIRVPPLKAKKPSSSKESSVSESSLWSFLVSYALRIREIIVKDIQSHSLLCTIIIGTISNILYLKIPLSPIAFMSILPAAFFVNALLISNIKTYISSTDFHVGNIFWTENLHSSSLDILKYYSEILDHVKNK
ncbi:hypothetical protein AGLY_011788 [Aphis glycines]|uniref:Uncharacterized protein n=1 Tax=Aphis glycines TaxID=307491 RepID=A0A6G0TBE3_APHGL|nr:hypothetical protein AGLY_011788 [Aphis glycines]